MIIQLNSFSIYSPADVYFIYIFSRTSVDKPVLFIYDVIYNFNKFLGPLKKIYIPYPRGMIFKLGQINKYKKIECV